MAGGISPTMSRAIDVALQYLGFGQARPKRVVDEPIAAVGADGDLAVDGQALRTSGDVSGIQAPATLPTLYSRRATLPGHRAVKPAVVLAHQTRKAGAPTVSRRVALGVLEELFLAPDPLSAATVIWFRNDQQCAPLQLVFALGFTAFDAEPSIVRWGEGGDAFFVKTGTSNGYWIFTLNREGERGFGTIAPIATLARRLLLTSPVTLASVLLTAALAGTVKTPIITRTAVVRSFDYVTEFDAWAATLDPTSTTYDLNKTTTSTVIVDDASLGAPAGAIGAVLVDEVLTKALDIIAVFTAQSAATGDLLDFDAGQAPFPEPRISDDGGSVTWPTRQVRFVGHPRRVNADLALEGDSGAMDVFVVNRSQARVVWSSCGGASTRTLSGRFAHGAHTLWDLIRAGTATGGDAETNDPAAYGTCVLDTGASATNSAYVGMQLLLIGTATDPIVARRNKILSWGLIRAYDGTTKTATLDFGSGYAPPSVVGTSRFAIWSSPVMPGRRFGLPDWNTSGIPGSGVPDVGMTYADYIASTTTASFAGSSPFFIGGEWRNWPLALVKTAVPSQTLTGETDLACARRAAKTIAITQTTSGTPYADSADYEIQAAEPPSSFAVLSAVGATLVVSGDASTVNNAAVAIRGSTDKDGSYVLELPTYDSGLDRTTLQLASGTFPGAVSDGRMEPLFARPPADTDWVTVGTITVSGATTASATYSTHPDCERRWWRIGSVSLTPGGSSPPLASATISVDPDVQWQIAQGQLFQLTDGSPDTSFDGAAAVSEISLGDVGRTDYTVATSARMLAAARHRIVDLVLSAGWMPNGMLGGMDPTAWRYVFYAPTSTLDARPGLFVSLMGTVHYVVTAGTGFDVRLLRGAARAFLTATRATDSATAASGTYENVGTTVPDVGLAAPTPGLPAPAAIGPQQFLAALVNGAGAMVATLLAWGSTAASFLAGTRAHVAWSGAQTTLTTFDDKTLASRAVGLLTGLLFLDPDFLWHRGDGSLADPPYFVDWDAVTATPPYAANADLDKLAVLADPPTGITPNGDVHVVNDAAALGVWHYDGP